MQEDSRLQMVMQKLGDTLDEATAAAAVPMPRTAQTGRPTVETHDYLAEREAAATRTHRDKAVTEAEAHEVEVAACVTQAWVRELVHKDRHLAITPEDVRCLWHALKAIGLVKPRG